MNASVNCQTFQRNADRRRSRIPAWVMFCLASGLGVCSAAENFWSVKKLNDNKPWDRFVESQSSIPVEGRIGSFGGAQFRLLHCDAKFTIDSAKLKSVTAKSVVEVRGKFKKDGSKIEFAVDEIQVRPGGYVEQYNSKASRLRRSPSAAWIELGDWTAEHANFYDDDELREKASEAYTSAMEVDYKSLKSNDAEGRLSLVKKFQDYPVAERRRMELIHEGLQIRWHAEQTAGPAGWRDLAELIEQKLPGSSQPLKTVAAALNEKYRRDPMSTYRTADDQLRIELHRLFYIDVVRKILMNEASKDGRNGDSIANQIDERIPEEHALAESQRELRLIFRLAHINTATKAEAEELSEAFQKRRQLDNARQARVQWIKAQESRLRDDGVVGLVRLADESLSLLNDGPAAAEFLKEAYKLDPTSEDVKAKLTSLGYQWRGSAWVKSSGKRPESGPAASKSPTGIRIGMTATELRTLLGQPRSLARAMTARGITEVWSFGLANSSGLVVRLEQTGRDSEPKVKAIPEQ